MDNTQRFSHKEQYYVKYRPHYPAALIPYLKETIGLTPQKVVADIGSGTGISTEIFLREGNEVYGVEPNSDMRGEAERILSAYPRFHSVDATAENTRLPDHSVDIIAAGQAFHWFDIAACRVEFARIARPDAWLVLFWNLRTVQSPFAKAYEQLLLDFGTDYLQVGHKQKASQDRIAAFFGDSSYHIRQFDNAQHLNLEQLKGRLLSTSYIPGASSPTYEPMLAQLKVIFDRYAEKDKVWFDYTTTIYTGKLPLSR